MRLDLGMQKKNTDRFSDIKALYTGSPFNNVFLLNEMQ